MSRPLLMSTGARTSFFPSSLTSNVVGRLRPPCDIALENVHAAALLLAGLDFADAYQLVVGETALDAMAAAQRVFSVVG